MPRFTEVLKDGLSREQLEEMLSTLGYNSIRKSDIRLRIKGMWLLKEAITALGVRDAQRKKSWELFVAVLGTESAHLKKPPFGMKSWMPKAAWNRTAFH